MLHISIRLQNCQTQTITPERVKNRSRLSLYHSVSLLLLVLKVIEKVIHSKTKNFLKKNKILYKHQSVFRKSLSTNSCLALLTNKTNKSFVPANYMGSILIDLQIAFETIDHENHLLKNEMDWIFKKNISMV